MHKTHHDDDALPTPALLNPGARPASIRMVRAGMIIAPKVHSGRRVSPVGVVSVAALCVSALLVATAETAKWSGQTDASPWTFARPTLTAGSSGGGLVADTNRHVEPEASKGQGANLPSPTARAAAPLEGPTIPVLASQITRLSGGSLSSGLECIAGCYGAPTAPRQPQTPDQPATTSIPQTEPALPQSRAGVLKVLNDDAPNKSSPSRR